MEEFNHPQEDNGLTEVTDHELCCITGGAVNAEEASKAVYQGLRADGRSRWQSAATAVVAGPEYVKSAGHADANYISLYVQGRSSYLREIGKPLWKNMKKLLDR